ncbi:MAG: hypothetical protein ACTSWN_16985 [Promethearchaeota archaeon]
MIDDWKDDVLSGFPKDLFLKLFQERFGIEAWIDPSSCRRFKSKRNITVQISLDFVDGGIENAFSEGPLVVKYFTTENREKQGIEMRTVESAASKGLAVPRILAVLGPFIVFAFEPGRNACDLLNSSSVSLLEKKRVAESLGSWYALFHGGMRENDRYLCRGDNTLRNFLYDDDSGTTGLDFEDAGFDEPMRDISEIVESILITRPGIYDPWSRATGKFKLAAYLIRSYFGLIYETGVDIDADFSLFLDLLLELMRHRAARRSQAFLFAEKESIIIKNVKKIVKPAFDAFQ